MADNYNHLMEQPTIFYALVFYIYLAGQADQLHVWLAWAYVALRVVHSLIQCTINRVPLRFLVFALATAGSDGHGGPGNRPAFSARSGWPSRSRAVAGLVRLRACAKYPFAGLDPPKSPFYIAAPSRAGRLAEIARKTLLGSQFKSVRPRDSGKCLKSSAINGAGR